METFGAALARVRMEAGFSQAELGELVGTGDSAVHYWEIGVSTPIAAHYSQLLELFPALRSIPRPGVRDMGKPGPQPGPKSSRRSRARPKPIVSVSFDDASCDCAELGLSCGLCRTALARAVS